ncbi:MAG: hypothetical protein JJ971_13710 [Balneolaceae bacterium]|nr:hypothetical protein [Balneolaceae bacterium]
MIASSLLILGLFIFPMWNILLKAPQYPDGIGMDIWINKIVGTNPNDIQNINLMNHYVGMDPIPTEMAEFVVFPWVIGIMSAIGLGIGLIRKRKLFLVWFVIMSVLGGIGLYDFYSWEYKYGHNLNPRAPIKVPGQSYQPPVFGYKKILNFEAYSYPSTGAYFLFTGMFGSVVAYFVDKKEEEDDEA